ncbi:MAG: glutamine amidotransferase [Pseudomonadota bacterium]
MNLLGHLPGGYNDWRVAVGAASHLGRAGVALLVAAAAVAIAVSALSLADERRGRGVLLFALRVAGVLACLLTALEPTVELRQVTHVPNRVAVLVDASRSMEVRPPDGGPSRAERAAALIDAAAPELTALQREGHDVDLYAFADALTPATRESLHAAPSGDATRIGEALGELRARYAGRDLGAVLLISDGVDTGRIGEGPLDATTRTTIEAMGAPIHTVGLSEKSLRDLSIATVLADELAFVRTPVTIEAVVRQNGLPDRQVDVTLERDGRPVATRGVILRGDKSEEKVSFDWLPDHPGNFVFRISTPVLAGEALSSNNQQSFTLKVIRDRVRVLHLAGRPSWDERFLRAMLRRDPNVDLVSFFILRTETDEQPWNHDDLSLIPFPTFEIFEEQLRSFDLVIFQNFNYAPYGVEPFLPNLRDYVEEGGALAMIGGDLSFTSGGYGLTPLRDILPVELPPVAPTLDGENDPALTTDTFKPRLTPEGHTHPITSLVLNPHENEAGWTKLPPLAGINRVPRVKPGAATLLVHPSAKGNDGKPAPVLAVGDAGKGRTLALLTDSAWHWGFMAAGEGDDGRAFQRFWENAVRWLVRDPALTLLRIELARQEYRRDQPITARVRAMHADYTAAPGVDVLLDINPAGAAAGTKPLRSLKVTTDSDGDAEVDAGLLPPGAYRMAAHATLDGRAVAQDETFVVRAAGPELDDVAARDRVLRELAQVSGGDYKVEKLPRLAVRPSREIRVGRQETVEVWSRPPLLVIGLALLLIEWTLRRRSGHV